MKDQFSDGFMSNLIESSDALPLELLDECKLLTPRRVAGVPARVRGTIQIRELIGHYAGKPMVGDPE